MRKGWRVSQRQPWNARLSITRCAVVARFPHTNRLRPVDPWIVLRLQSRTLTTIITTDERRVLLLRTELRVCCCHSEIATLPRQKRVNGGQIGLVEEDVEVYRDY
jgi:hypothetical protein